MSQPAELRILSGVHEGARAPVPADGSPVRIGRSSECELILRDAAFESATLVCEAGQWRLAIGNEPAVALNLGEAARLGVVLVQVSDAQAAWPDLNTLIVGFEQLAAEGSDPHTAPVTAPTDPAQLTSGPEGLTQGAEDPPAAAVASNDSAGSPPPARGRFVWRVTALSVAVLLGLLGLAWSMLSPLGPTSHSPLSTGSVTPLTEAVTAEELAAMTQAIARAGYAQRVRVLSAPDGRALLAGVLDSDEDQEAVLRAASAVSRRLRLSLLTTAEFAAKIRELRDQVPGELEIRPSRDGKLVLTGLSDEPALIDDAINWLRKALPEASGIQVEALSRAEAVARFARTVRDAQLGDIQIRWDGQRLLARGELFASRLARWEKLWLSFASRYGERLKASVELSVLPDPASLVAKPDPVLPDPEELPVTIVALADPPARLAPRIVLPPIAAVVSGPRGHVMLRDGSLILTGGVVNGFRLMAIEDAVLVFEDSRGHEFRVSR